MKSIEQVHEQCCEAARCLLAAFEARDRGMIEHEVRVIRGYLRQREPNTGTEAGGQRILRHEQLEALEAIVGHLEGCLQSVRETEQSHFDRILQTQDLLAHLARRWDSLPSALLPVC